MHAPPRPHALRASTGFTLLELLAVIVIIGILSTVLITQLGGAEDAARSSQARMLIKQIEQICNEYELEHGAYPPSRFTPEQGVPNDGENVGIEALVVALYSNGWEAGGHELDDEAFGNTDGDFSGRSLTDFGNRALNELLDPWGNPIAYLFRTDYGSDDRIYVTISEIGEELRTPVLAVKDPVKGRYFKHSKFQLISAGADGVFNTEDDIANFEAD